MKSRPLRVVSRTRSRTTGWWRRRRGRVWGNMRCDPGGKSGARAYCTGGGGGMTCGMIKLRKQYPTRRATRPRVEAIRSEVQRLMRTVPFRPFALSLENGDRVMIGHPENIAFDPTPNGGSEALRHLEQVAAVQHVRGRHERGADRSGRAGELNYGSVSASRRLGHEIDQHDAAERLGQQELDLGYAPPAGRGPRPGRRGRGRRPRGSTAPRHAAPPDRRSGRRRRRCPARPVRGTIRRPGARCRTAATWYRSALAPASRLPWRSSRAVIGS